LIATAFSGLPNVDEIYYLCSKTAILPQSEKATIRYVDSVASLENTVNETLILTDIDIIIHSMAVSDYRVKSVTSTSKLANAIISQRDELKNIDTQSAEKIVTELLKTSESIIGSNGKISSDIDNMLLLMERTPKIISSFQVLAPNATLVGFKLLDSVSQEMLIDTACRLLQDNKCTLVLANDLSEINENGHVGYLVDKDKNYKRFTTKEEIAEAIVAATTEIRSM